MNLITITTDPIFVEDLLAEMETHLCCGAFVWFLGVVRDENEGSKVKEIYYECYEGMAKKELSKIAEEAKGQWGVHQIAIAHRIGSLPVGETSLIAVVSSPHRKEAFAALEQIIDRLKVSVPIWKKEIYAEENARWIGE